MCTQFCERSLINSLEVFRPLSLSIDEGSDANLLSSVDVTNNKRLPKENQMKIKSKSGF